MVEHVLRRLSMLDKLSADAINTRLFMSFQIHFIDKIVKYQVYCQFAYVIKWEHIGKIYGFC